MKKFSDKYNTTFKEFEKKIENSIEENFEEWDDYIEWKAYAEALNYWKSVKEEVSK
ncbi:MAG: hypothetical protein ACE5J3_11825 [Methanosarcinales archaeon]